MVIRPSLLLPYGGRQGLPLSTPWHVVAESALLSSTLVLDMDWGLMSTPHEDEEANLGDVFYCLDG